jgi:hypothetical protein
LERSLCWVDRLPRLSIDFCPMRDSDANFLFNPTESHALMDINDFAMLIPPSARLLDLGDADDGRQHNDEQFDRCGTDDCGSGSAVGALEVADIDQENVSINSATGRRASSARRNRSLTVHQDFDSHCCDANRAPIDNSPRSSDAARISYSQHQLGLLAQALQQYESTRRLSLQSPIVRQSLASADSVDAIEALLPQIVQAMQHSSPAVAKTVGQQSGSDSKRATNNKHNTNKHHDVMQQVQQRKQTYRTTKRKQQQQQQQQQ